MLPKRMWKTQNSPPWTQHHRTITLQSQVLAVQLPFGGFVWQRPTAVLVSENGRTIRTPIPDPIRTIWLASKMTMILLLLVQFIYPRKRKIK